MQDFHRADDIANRLKKLIPPQLLENEDSMDEESLVPGQMTGSPGMPGQPMQQDSMQEQPGPDPMAEIQAAEIRMNLEERQIKLDQEKAKLETIQLENAEKKQITKDQVKALVQQMMSEGMANRGQM